MQRRLLGVLALSGFAYAGCGDDGGGEGGMTEPATTMGSPTGDPTSGSPTSMGSSGSMTGADSSGSGSSTGGLACPYDPVDGNPSMAFELVGEGFDRPVFAVGDPDEPGRLYVAEQGGTVRVLEPGDTMAPADPWLTIDVANTTSLGDERGLLGFALHADFPTDPRVYVAFSDPGNQSTRIDEWTVNGDTPGDRRTVIAADQPAGNHNGGMIDFGPDGYLYIGLGDGGGADDLYNTGRDTNVILAKILRIGVDPDGSPDMPVACGGSCAQLGPFDYTIPADNPFVGMANWAEETFAWGVRNPWRFSFDPVEGDLYVADVGQNQWEEVTIAAPGADLGWSTMESNHCFMGAACDDAAMPGAVNADGMTMAIAEYDHGVGNSITGLGVYRSCEVPAWDGWYFYSDYTDERYFAVVWDGATATDMGQLTTSPGERPLGGGYNAFGDVFVTVVETTGPPLFGDGKIYRVAPGA